MSEPTAPRTFGPYSQLRRAGNFYFTAGQLGIDPATGVASQAVAQQAKQALENLKDVLAQSGLSMDDVIKTTIYVTDIGSFGSVNDVYVTYFGEPRPARSTVGVKELPRVGGDVTLHFEIEAVAYKETP